ncbi:hypothetical protein B0G73_107220 [Paraburkholderia sp. BL25I1N1]|nr:hypothetical protein B0G73_107220 [Paraburkholderia sp. BL25I1N1]
MCCAPCSAVRLEGNESLRRCRAFGGRRSRWRIRARHEWVSWGRQKRAWRLPMRYPDNGFPVMLLESKCSCRSRCRAAQILMEGYAICASGTPTTATYSKQGLPECQNFSCSIETDSLRSGRECIHSSHFTSCLRTEMITGYVPCSSSTRATTDIVSLSISSYTLTFSCRRLVRPVQPDARPSSETLH